MTNIFIANLDWDVSSEDLQATFSAFGEVHLAHVVFDAKTKKSKGFGYVEMVTAEEAIKAIQALNGFEVNGRRLDVKIASPKANRPKKEDKPAKKPFAKKPFAKKPGGFGGQKRFNSDSRPEGGSPRPYNSGNSGGSYRPNTEGGDQRSGGYRSSGQSSYNSGTNRPEGGSYRPQEENKPSGERQLRPRRKFNND